MGNWLREMPRATVLGLSAVTASAVQSPVSSTSYNLYSEPTAVSYASLDSDAFTFDGNTGRMTQYKVNVSSSYIQGALNWNYNGSLYQQVITDQVNTGHSQTCTYVYDDLARSSQVDCGSGHWGQNYTYDALGNMNRTGFNGGTSFSLPYTATTNQINYTGYTYDANGNLTADNGTHTYSWDAEGKLYQLGSNTLTYDALGRRVEQSNAEILYAPSGRHLVTGAFGDEFALELGPARRSELRRPDGLRPAARRSQRKGLGRSERSHAKPLSRSQHRYSRC